MLNPYIDFARDTTSKSDAFWYRIVWLLGTLQGWVLDRCIKQPVWRSFDGTVHTPRSMTDGHLLNSIRFCERNNEEVQPTYNALRAEAKRRNLTLLKEHRYAKNDR